MEENGEFRRFVRESIETGDFEKGRRENGGGYFDDPSEIPDRIDLARPLDFLAGYTLLPRRAPAGKHNAETRFESIRGAGLEVTGAEDENLTEEIWFTYTCRFGSGSGSVYYRIPLRKKTEAHTRYFSALLSALAKYAAGFTQREIGPVKAGGGISARPGKSSLENAVRVDAGITVADKIFPVQIYVTPSFIESALAVIEEPPDVPAVPEARKMGLPEGGKKRYASAPTSGLLSLSLSLLLRGIERIDRAGVFAERTELVRVSELSVLLGPEDSRKVVQNLFLARGRGVDELTRLFYYRTGGGGQSDAAKPKLAADPQFRKEDFLSLLPRNLRGEWNPAAGYSQNRNELYAANRRALEEVAEAVETDRLTLSYRGRHLIRRAVQARLDAGYEKRIKQIFQKNLVSDLLRSLPKPAAQRTVSAFPSDELARILLADPGSIETFSPFISKNKRRDVEEQHRLLGTAFGKGKLSFNSIYRSLYNLLTELKNAREKEEEEQ